MINGLFVYHLVPIPLEGTTLYPLNQLQAARPGLYTQHAKKYLGRENIMEEQLPLLHCKWNDVLHFSSTHPKVIVKELFASLKRLGIGESEIPDREWFEVPYSAIQSLPHVFFENHPSAQRQADQHLSADFRECNESELSLAREFPQEMRDYYDDCYRKGVRPLLFNRLPHVLVQAPIETSKFNRFSWL